MPVHSVRSRGIGIHPIALFWALATAMVAGWGCRHGEVETEVLAESVEVDGDYALRAQAVIDQVADHYRPTDYHDRGKYSFPKAMARFEKYGLSDEEANRYIEEYAGGRYGFFHFPFVGMARLIGRYGEAPSLRAHKREFLGSILNPEPGFHYNALTGEGTENHIGMSRTSGYLFAIEAAAYPELSATAESWREQLDPWLREWSHRVYGYGTGEWDSSVYTTYNLIGWLNIHDFAPDPELRACARAVLDYYAAAIALKYTEGILSGAESRGATRYGPLPRTATEYLGWLWFGDSRLAETDGFWSAGEYIQAMHAITSSYRPPRATLEIARKRLAPATYHNTKPDYRLLQRGLIGEVFHIDHSFTLGSAQTPLGGWLNGNYGIINWKMVIENPDGAPGVVWGNGEMKSADHARGRNPFDQFFQYRNTLIQMTRVPQNAEELQAEVETIVARWIEDYNRDFFARWGRAHHDAPGPISTSAMGDLASAQGSRIYFPSGSTVEAEDGVIFLRYADTLLALRTLSGRTPVVGDNSAHDSAPRGEMAGFVLEAINLSDFGGDAAAARDAVLERTRLVRPPESPLSVRYDNLAGDRIEVTYAESGSWTELNFDFGYGITGQQVSVNSPDWQIPDFPSGLGHGRIPRARVNGAEVSWRAGDPIYDGPQIRLQARILQLRDRHGNLVHQVDFTGPIPVFAPEGRMPINPELPIAP